MANKNKSNQELLDELNGYTQERGSDAGYWKELPGGGREWVTTGGDITYDQRKAAEAIERYLRSGK